MSGRDNFKFSHTIPLKIEPTARLVMRVRITDKIDFPSHCVHCSKIGSAKANMVRTSFHTMVIPQMC